MGAVPTAAVAEGDDPVAGRLQAPGERGAGPPYVQGTEVDTRTGGCGPVGGEAVPPGAEQQTSRSAPVAPESHGVVGEGVAGAADREQRQAGGGAERDEAAALPVGPEPGPGRQFTPETRGQPLRQAGDRKVFEQPGVVGQRALQGVRVGVAPVAVGRPPAGPGPQSLRPPGSRARSR